MKIELFSSAVVESLAGPKLALEDTEANTRVRKGLFSYGTQILIGDHLKSP